MLSMLTSLLKILHSPLPYLQKFLGLRFLLSVSSLCSECPPGLVSGLQEGKVTRVMMGC